MWWVRKGEGMLNYLQSVTPFKCNILLPDANWVVRKLAYTCGGEEGGYWIQVMRDIAIVYGPLPLYMRIVAE